LNDVITTVCKIAILLNFLLFGVGVYYGDTYLPTLSIINIALLSTRFLFIKGDKE
jgi:hypothetical protein